MTKTLVATLIPKCRSLAPVPMPSSIGSSTAGKATGNRQATQFPIGSDFSRSVG